MYATPLPMPVAVCRMCGAAHPVAQLGINGERMRLCEDCMPIALDFMFDSLGAKKPGDTTLAVGVVGNLKQPV